MEGEHALVNTVAENKQAFTTNDVKRAEGVRELQSKIGYPSMKQFINSNFDVEEASSNVNESLAMLSTCIDMVYNEEESWETDDCSPEELKEFIEQLNTKQFKDVENFFDTMPKLEHKIKVTNPKTGVESEVVLEGLASFFS